MKQVEQDKVSLIFLSKKLFHSNSVRSFLQVLEKNTGSSRVVNLPDNLYQISEDLVEDLRTIYIPFGLQLFDGIQYSISLSIRPQPTEWKAFVLEIEGDKIANRLLGEGGNRTFINWLIELLSTGGRMTRAECAFLCFGESSQTIELLCWEHGGLNLEQLPPIFWMAAHRVTNLSSITTKASPIKQSDGSVLLMSL